MFSHWNALIPKRFSGKIKVMRGPFAQGLSFLEVMVSVFILAVVFLYLVPVFLITPRYRYQEMQILQASLFAQAIMETIRIQARNYNPANEGANDVFTQLENIYAPGNLSVMQFFQRTPFDPLTSYIKAYGTDDNQVSRNSGSKRIVIHLEWNAPAGSTSIRETYTASAQVAQAYNWFPIDPQVVVSTSTSTISTSTTSNSTTSTVNTNTSTSNNTTSNSTTTSPTTTTSESDF